MRRPSGTGEDPFAENEVELAIHVALRNRLGQFSQSLEFRVVRDRSEIRIFRHRLFVGALPITGFHGLLEVVERHAVFRSSDAYAAAMLHNAHWRGRPSDMTHTQIGRNRMIVSPEHMQRVGQTGPGLHIVGLLVHDLLAGLHHHIPVLVGERLARRLTPLPHIVRVQRLAGGTRWVPSWRSTRRPAGR